MGISEIIFYFTQRQKLCDIEMFVMFSPITFFFMFLCSVPRSGPRNIRVYDPTTSTLSVSWEHAEGPVMQYRITYAPTVGDPIEEYVSMFMILHVLVILSSHISSFWPYPSPECRACLNVYSITKVWS